MTGAAWTDGVLLALVLLFGTAAIVFAALWATAHDREAEPAPAAASDRHAATACAALRPDDPTLPDDDAAVIAAAVARAVDAYASYLIALRDGMPATVLATLREQMYADLRESLTAPQLARALVIGLHPHADDRTRALLDTDSLSTERLES